MKKILTALVVLTMVFVSAQALAAGPDTECYPTGDCAWDDQFCIEDIPTSATITGGSGGGGGTDNSAPIIKCKWEYDLEVQIIPEDCDPCIPCNDPYWEHDACCCIPALQVKPVLYDSVTVGYYAVVTDPEGVDHVDHVYADIWHPDGTFKYQIELFPVGFDTAGAYDKTVALDLWTHANTYHSDLIKINDVWEATLPTEITAEEDILDELDEELAYLYYGTAEISYCQPGGWYYVGVRAHDGFDAWCEYLFNRFWYIPTAGFAVDFSSIDYGTVAESSNKWVGGDYDFNTPLKPTIRNIGNTPIELYVWQDDMDFGMTGMNWNVEFDVRMNSDGTVRVFEPYEVDTNGETTEDYPGVRIPGVLELCTEEKLDFSIHVYKGFPGETYTGLMNLCALIHMNSYVWDTPLDFEGDAPLGVPQDYDGPTQPGPDDGCSSPS